MQSDSDDSSFDWILQATSSEEQQRRIQQVVQEIAQLEQLVIEGICRHFPHHSDDIREVARHLLADTSKLMDPDCCQERWHCSPRSGTGNGAVH